MSDPEPPQTDENAAWFTGMESLDSLDDRGLPTSFPEGFPVPQGATVVRAERSLPGGRDAARELALFLMPPPLVPGYEAVVALGTLAHELSHRIDAPRLFQRRPPAPVKVATAAKSLLRRLDVERLTLLRHACLTLINNTVNADRHLSPDGLTLKRDRDGHLYAADIRDRMNGVLDESLIPMAETAVAVVECAPIVFEVFAGVRTAAVRPPADRYAWVFRDLDSRRLGATRDAVWNVLQPYPPPRE